MTYLRGQERMVIQTTIDYLSSCLTSLGWMAVAGSRPYGAQYGVIIQDDMPVLESAIAPNTVAITEGPTLADEEGELGAGSGGLWLTRYTIFIDVFGENIGIAKAIAGDVRAILTGRLTSPVTNQYQPLIDYSQTPPAPAGALIEYQDVVSDRPLNQEFQKSWMTVKATAELQWNGAQYT